jgi:hypothetical protein
MMTHRLVGGGKENIGYHAVRWESILQGQVGEFGQYKVLSVLPDKVARYLFEFHADSFSSLNLPALPNDRRDSGTIHSLLKAVQVGFINAASIKYIFCIICILCSNHILCIIRILFR